MEQALGQIRGFTMWGGQAVPAIVRAEAAPGICAIHVAGLPDGTGADLAARVVGALQAVGVAWPATRLQIDIRPRRGPIGRELDLAAALAALVALGKLQQPPLARFVAAAGLLPSGLLAPIEGIEAVALQVAARELILICADCQAEAATRAGDGDVLGMPDMMTLLRHLGGRLPFPPAVPAIQGTEEPDTQRPAVGGFSERDSIVIGTAVSLGSRGPDPAAEAVAVRHAPVPIFTSTGPQGHRGRMREKVLERGTDALADYELLEMLLFLAFKMGDTKPLAKRLINVFGSFAGVLAAPSHALLPLQGVNDHVATTVQIVRASAERLARAEVASQPVLNNWDKLIAYLTTVMARESIEQFRVLFLDTRNRLLADEALGRGTVNHTPVYPREVAKRALELHATALILVHNHPSGDPTPSRDDVEMTLQVKGAAAAIGVVLHDHIIIGAGGWCSLRKEGHL